jgi:sulfite exporter TauE/SafE
MNMIIWYSALLMGFAGSLHCVGMCGPLLIAVQGRAPTWHARLLYHAGRILIYTTIGSIAGMMGGALRLGMAQETISIAAGILMLGMALMPAAMHSSLPGLRHAGALFARIQRTTRPLWQKKTAGGQFMLGMLNGILPCGFVYAGLAGALSAGSSAGGATWMLLFGMGTMPALLTMGIAGRLIPQGFIRRFMPVGTSVAAILFILRGLSLGIPFVSPRLPEYTPSAQDIKPVAGQEQQYMPMPEQHLCGKPDGGKSREIRQEVRKK